MSEDSTPIIQKVSVDQNIPQDDITESAENDAHVVANLSLTRTSKKLPSLCLERIIHFCNIKDVFHGCMAVNREWEQTSRCDIKSRKCLKIYDPPELDLRGATYVPCMTPDVWDIDCLIVPKAVKQSVIESLKQMTSVTRLEIENGRSNDYESLTITLAPQLEELNLVNDSIV